MPAIGIDFGTANLRVAVHGKDGGTVVLRNKYDMTATPACVAIKGATRLVGESAKLQSEDNIKNTFYNVKLVLGRSFHSVCEDDPPVMGAVPVQCDSNLDAPRFHYREEETEHQRATVSPEEVCAMMLSHMASVAELRLEEPVSQVVIAVPAFFNSAQRQALKDAAAMSRLEVLSLVNDTTATALHYASGHDLEGVAVVVDVGAGGGSVSVVRVSGRIHVEVLATSSRSFPGGNSFDYKMMRYFAAVIWETHKKNLYGEPVAQAVLRSAWEQAKHRLSNAMTVDLEVYLPGIDVFFSSKISRQQFENNCWEIMITLKCSFEEILSHAGMKPNDVASVILVGGSSRVPMVHKAVSEYFPKSELVHHQQEPDTVARGAAVLAAALSGVEPLAEEVTVQDVVALQLTMHDMNGKTVWSLKSNAPLPVEENIVIPCGNRQATVLQVDQGGYTGRFSTLAFVNVNRISTFNSAAIVITVTKEGIVIFRRGENVNLQVAFASLLGSEEIQMLSKRMVQTRGAGFFDDPKISARVSLLVLCRQLLEQEIEAERISVTAAFLQSTLKWLDAAPDRSVEEYEERRTVLLNTAGQERRPEPEQVCRTISGLTDCSTPEAGELEAPDLSPLTPPSPPPECARRDLTLPSDESDLDSVSASDSGSASTPTPPTPSKRLSRCSGQLPAETPWRPPSVERRRSSERETVCSRIFKSLDSAPKKTLDMNGNIAAVGGLQESENTKESPPQGLFVFGKSKAPSAGPEVLPPDSAEPPASDSGGETLFSPFTSTSLSWRLARKVQPMTELTSTPTGTEREPFWSSPSVDRMQTSWRSPAADKEVDSPCPSLERIPPGTPIPAKRKRVFTGVLAESKESNSWKEVTKINMEPLPTLAPSSGVLHIDGGKPSDLAEAGERTPHPETCNNVPAIKPLPRTLKQNSKCAHGVHPELTAKDTRVGTVIQSEDRKDILLVDDVHAVPLQPISVEGSAEAARCSAVLAQSSQPPVPPDPSCSASPPEDPKSPANIPSPDADLQESPTPDKKLLEDVMASFQSLILSPGCSHSELTQHPSQLLEQFVDGRCSPELARALRRQEEAVMLSMSEATVQRVMREVRDAGRVALLVDTIDTPHKDMVSMMLRYVQGSGDIVERLVALEEARSATGKGLFRRFEDVFRKHDMDWTKLLVAVGMDTAKSTKDSYAELLSLLQEQAPSTKLVWNTSHRMEVLVAQAWEDCAAGKEFCGVVNCLLDFLRVPKRAMALANHCQEGIAVPLTSGSLADWVSFLVDNSSAIMDTLVALKEGDSTTAYLAKELISSMVESEFIVVVAFAYELFLNMEPMATALTFTETCKTSKIAKKILQQQEKMNDSFFERIITKAEGRALPKISNEMRNYLMGILRKLSKATLEVIVPRLSNGRDAMRDIDVLVLSAGAGDFKQYLQMFFASVPSVDKEALADELCRASSLFEVPYDLVRSPAEIIRGMIKLQPRRNYRLIYPNIYAGLLQLCTVPLVQSRADKNMLESVRLWLQESRVDLPLEPTLILLSAADTASARFSRPFHLPDALKILKGKIGLCLS